VPPELGRQRQVHVRGPGFGFEVLPRGFDGGSGEEVVFGEGDDPGVRVATGGVFCRCRRRFTGRQKGTRPVDRDDFQIMSGWVVKECGAVAGLGGGEDGRRYAGGVEGLVDADEHERGEMHA
jgi:hypothetical protein